MGFKTSKTMKVEFDLLIENFTYAIRKNTKTKKAFKIAFIDSKIKNKFLFKEFCFYVHKVKGILYSSVYKGFIVESVEYIEEKIAIGKTTKDMQEEWLAKNKAKKLEDGGYQLTDIERVSRGHRDSYKNEIYIEPVFDGLEFYDKNNRKFKAIAVKKRTSIRPGFNQSYRCGKLDSISSIDYYRIIGVNNSGELVTRRGNHCIKESTLKENFKLGIFKTTIFDVINELKEEDKMENMVIEVNFDNDNWDIPLNNYEI